MLDCSCPDWKARVQRGCTLVECSTSMPIVAAALGGDHDRTGRCPPCVCIFVRCAHRKFLNAVRREVLQKSADPVVRVVGAIHRKLIVQARTPACRDSGNAGFRGIGRFDRFRPGHEISNIGKASSREWQSLQILTSNDAAPHRARCVNRCGSNRGRVALHSDGLCSSARLQNDGNIVYHCHCDRNARSGRRKARSADRDPIIAR